MPDPPVCVYCRRRPVDARWRPFCSQRCQLFDLARWVDGDYRIAGDSTSDAAASHQGETPQPPDHAGTDTDRDDRR